MLTTTQVRNIIRKNSESTYGIYTNKTRDDNSLRRRVKCYFRGNVKLLVELQRAAGAGNVKLTEGSNSCFGGGPAIVVKCVLG